MDGMSSPDQHESPPDQHESPPDQHESRRRVMQILDLDGRSEQAQLVVVLQMLQEQRVSLRFNRPVSLSEIDIGINY